MEAGDVDREQPSSTDQSTHATAHAQPPSARDEEPESCPVCGFAQLEERRCKVICRNCRTIVRSCADLGA